MHESPEQSNDPLHGVTLKALLEDLVFRYGWPGLAERIDINCFKSDPSVRSSLKFLRKTPWARTKVERLYITDKQRLERNRKRSEREAQQATQESVPPTEETVEESRSEPSAPPQPIEPTEPTEFG